MLIPRLWHPQEGGGPCRSLWEKSSSWVVLLIHSLCFSPLVCLKLGGFLLNVLWLTY